MTRTRLDDQYSPFLVVECHRCGELALQGRAGGLNWRMGTRTIPLRHALVLKRYGVTVLVLRSTGGRTYGEPWFPPGEVGDRIVAPHICGSQYVVEGRTTPKPS
jgi:hypothetical protein